ncbi:MAG TPA: pilus assembly protein [Alphaproteobacteria bacterium]|nr:MAG: pilus assembly protein [Rhodospirillales bacterium]HOO81437.1 pilus assembly protein [Alphaproteobacteria bacterium]
MLKRMFLNFVRYYRDTRAAIAILFALMAPLLIGTVGMAIDLSQAYLVQQRLAQAIDAAALAAAAISSDEATIEQKVQDFFDVNYPPEKLGVTFDPVVVIEGNLVTVTGNASYLTSFLRVLGIDNIDVTAETVVQREVKGLEVVLVLDNTGSMASNNNIGKLRTAACEFVEILYGTYDEDASGDCLDRYGSYVTAQNEYVKIGLVPYATSVNVGPYGLGYDDDGNVYADPFLNNPLGLSFSNDADTNICILEEDDGSDVLDHSGPWYMYRWCRDKNDDSAQCNYYNNYICVGDQYNSSGSTCLDWDYSAGARTVYRAPEYSCPAASVLPLTDDMTALKDRIGEMEANGWTFGNIGMAWGWRMLSPEVPFTEGVDWDNTAWRKVVVMMTDGDNVRSSPYGGFGINGTHSVSSSSVLDDRLRDVCENMDAQDNVTVYTITFDTGGIDSTTEQLYEDCAGNGGSHKHVTTSDELIQVFRSIAQELSNLHIKS